MFSDFSSNITGIEIGIDIATSVTIIISLIALVLESRRQAKKEREKGVDQNARNVAANQIARMLSKLSSIFISRIVDSAQEFERRIDIFYEGDDGKQRLLRRARNDSNFFSERKSELSDLRKIIGDFFENLHEMKYQVIPVLDTLDNGEQFISALKKEIHDIAVQHGKLSDYLALINEFDELAQALANESEVNNEVIKMAGSIVVDLDYWDWVQFFAAANDRGVCRELLENKKYGDERVKSMIANLLAHTKESPESQRMEIYALASSQILKARVECKEVLCNISAIYHVMISKDLGVSLSSVIDRYKGDDYLSINKEIR